MIIWQASFPRSGSTFFRILAHHLYGLPTYTGFFSGDDLDFIGAGHVTGHESLPEELASALREGRREDIERYHALERIFLVKTHGTAQEVASSGLPAVLIVRDPQDALVSFAWYNVRIRPRFAPFPGLRRFLREERRHRRQILLAMRIRSLRALGFEKWLFRSYLKRAVSHERWSLMNGSWLERETRPTHVVRFEDLVARPVASVTETFERLGVTRPVTSRDFPEFAELQTIYPDFFREGLIGKGRESFSPEISRILAEVHGDRMRELGYPVP